MKTYKIIYSQNGPDDQDMELVEMTTLPIAWEESVGEPDVFLIA